MLEGLFPPGWDARSPGRAPLVCGALGPGTRRAVVERVAAGLEAPMSIAHETAEALFLTDRKPRIWRHRRTKGLTLPETPSPAPVRPREWQQAATELDAMGLCVNPNRTLIHTSVSGVAPVYYAVEGEAVYFASRIDALVLGLGTERRADWRAWSAILTHASPFGERTPFAGVSRLRQQSALWWGDGELRVREEPWAWSAVQPELSVEQGTPAVVEALGDSIEALGDGPLVTLLSGGADSRVVLLGALQRRDPSSIIALTHDTGRETEAGVAAEVAKAVGVRHELIAASGPDEYWESWLRRTERSDWQFCADVFIAHLTNRVAELGYPVLDGLALDVFGARGGRGYDLKMFGDESDMTARMMWESTSSRALSRAPLLAFGPEKGEAMRAISRRQAIVESRPFRGNMNHPLLLWYATRTFRGVSLGPRQVFGASAPTYTPVCTHRVVSAALAIDPIDKWGSRFFNELLGLLGTEAATIPRTAELPKGPSRGRTHRFGDAPETLERFDDALRNPGIASLIGDEMSQVLEQRRLGEVLGNANWRRAVIELAHLSTWQRRYESILRPLSIEHLSKPQGDA